MTIAALVLTILLLKPLIVNNRKSLLIIVKKSHRCDTQPLTIVSGSLLSFGRLHNLVAWPRLLLDSRYTSISSNITNLVEDMTAAPPKSTQEPSPNTAPKMKSKHMLSVRDLLRNQMGMSDTAASATALRAQRNDPPTAFMRKFLHAAIENQIDEYKKQSFAKFGLDIAVFPTPNGMRLKLLVEHFGEVTVGYHSYTFRPNHNAEPLKTLRVRLFHGGIQVHFCGSWQPISAYLDEISTDWTYPAPQHLELERQYYWWRSNGKSFEITKLPGEICNAIFDFAFPSEAQPFPSSRCLKRGRLVPTYQRSYTALMRTNRQLYQESSDLFYKTTTFSIGHQKLFSKTLDNRFLRDRLRHVRLSLTHSGYLDLFSSKDEDFSTKPCVKHQLREMSNLTSLVIHINPPSRITEKVWLEGACQKTAVNMIIDAAWPSIKGLPVTITGSVKDSQKKSIEARVRSERTLYLFFEAWCRDVQKSCSLRAYDAWMEGMRAEEQGGVRLDGETCADVRETETETETETLWWKNMSTQDLKLDLWCTCEKRCSADDWDSAD